MTRILAAGLVLLSLTAAAAAETPVDQQACNYMTDQLAEAVEEKSLDENQEAEYRGLISTLLLQCEANQLAEAGQTADRIRAFLGG